MRIISKAVLPALLVLLAACRSDPVHYHTLSPLLESPTQTLPTSGNLTIERLTVPPQVDRSQLVVRQGSNGLAILETDWWGASLADELQSALAQQLNQVQFNGRASLRVQVQRFDLVPGRYALLDIKWRLRSAPPGGEVQELHCQSIVQSPADESVQDMVRAQQGNLQKIASMIGASGRGRCPAG
jgi:uncharacterized lipoprotein YmbA